MAQDVFISYSSVDKIAADTVCSILEQNGLGCWIAPRDITPGLDFAEAIIDGIKSSKLFILVYSSNSNNSKQVIREVDRAVHFGLQVINLRLEDVPMSKQLDYYLSSVHWLDAKSPSLEEHINKLSGVVKILLRKDGAREEDLEKAIRDGILQVGQDKKSIAVMPFKNMSNDPDQEYFSDGMMEEILDRLVKIGDLKVISRTSSMHYKNSDKPVKEIARELGVANIIEGSVRRAGNMVRIAVQLIDAGTDAHLWSEMYDADLGNLSRIFIIQSEVAQSVARELKAVISPQEIKLIEKIPSIDINAYDDYLKARSYWGDGSKESLQQALEYLNDAIEEEPGWAPLYSGMVQVWMAIQNLGFEPPSVAAPKIFENLNKALELDPDLSEAHYLNAIIAQLVEWNWEKSEKEFLEALAINPNDAISRGLYAQLLCILQRSDEGIAQGRLALNLDPLNQAVKCWYAAILLCVDDCKTALTLLEQITADDPGHYLANSAIESAAFCCKDYDKVIKAVKYILTARGISMAQVEMIYEQQGFESAYKEVLRQFEELTQSNFFGPAEMAIRYAMANEPDKAIEWFEKGYEIHDPIMTYINTKMFGIDYLFNNPRFIAILKKMNLPLPKTD
ncbi:MAG: TIR domain-containing protein [Prolixibacteraceae bacterium]|nr:TIR domain-containing protein [Prolixibacteraceae bacterium]